MRDTQNKSGAARVREMHQILKREGLLRHPTPVKLRRTLEELGPTYVKLGQILSMRPDILPREYCRELERLRTNVKPLSFDEVVSVIEHEQKKPWREVFRELEQTCIGSASIAQVHAALLPDGRRVVVKVQRPGIRETMEQDVLLLRRVFQLLNAVSALGGVIDLCMVLDEMWQAAQQEMDFLTEADHLNRFAELNREVRYVDCPHPDMTLTTPRMLVMPDVGGIQIDDTSELDENGYDRDEIGTKLVDNYMKQILDDGFFHADPHPGNIRIVEGKIVWLDLGMVGELGRQDRHTLGSMIEAVAAGDIMGLKTGLLTLGVVDGPIDHAALYDEVESIVQRYASLDFGSMDLGTIMEELLDTASRYGISMPPGVTMLGRGIVTIEGVLSSLCPEVNFIRLAANRVKGHTFDWAHQSEELKKAGSVLIHNAGRAVRLPGQLGDLLQMTVKGQTSFHTELSVQESSMRRFERIAANLVLAVLDLALWLSGALLYVNAPYPTLWDSVPAIGFLLLASAFLLGIWLCWRLRPARKHRKHVKKRRR